MLSVSSMIKVFLFENKIILLTIKKQKDAIERVDASDKIKSLSAK